MDKSGSSALLTPNSIKHLIVVQKVFVGFISRKNSLSQFVSLNPIQELGNVEN